MARKKTKSKRSDARGYNQSDVPPKYNMSSNPQQRNSPYLKSSTISRRQTSAIQLTDTLETQLRDFLGEFPLPGTVAIPSDRFEKRLTSIYDRLIDLGFAFEDIRQAVLQLNYHITLELALDWLCWHVDTLPPRFTDERLEQSNATSSVWVEPVVKPVHRNENHSLLKREDEGFFPLRDPVSSSAPYQKLEEEDTTDKNETAMSVAQKKWLLAQYQYEEVASNEEKTEEIDLFQNLRIEANDLSTEQVVDESDELNQDRSKLVDLQAELDPLEAQLNDEASCYMMSKHELKTMRGQVKLLKNQIKVLEGKIAGRQRKAALQRSTNESLVGPVEEDDDEEEEANTFNIFSNDNDKMCGGITGAVDSEMNQGTANESNSQFIPKDSVPKSWTGMKPKALLEDYCRRNKLPQPTFQRMTKSSCKLKVKISTVEEKVAEFDQDGPTLADAQHFAATRALFQLDPKASITHLLPPFHRQIWLEWKSVAETLENKIKMDEGAGRRIEIEQLLSQLSQVDLGSSKEGVFLSENDVNRTSSIEKADTFVWDDAEKPHENLTANVSKDDVALKSKFEKLQHSREYQRLLKSRKKLPVYAFRDMIQDTIDKNPVTIISAETGAGKTTQVPQFLLANAFLKGNGSQTSVICTQPRRVAATSVAERVAEEFGEASLGGLVGYQIRMESIKSSRTKLLFCTTGVILRRLIEDPVLNGVSHVVVDEVHERQWQIDILLIALRTLLQGRRPDLKVVLMSATLDSSLFSSYFWSAPVLKIPGRTFPVKNYFLEDLLEKTGHIIEEGSRCAKKSFARSEVANLWVSTRGGGKRLETACLQSEIDTEVSSSFQDYSMTTRRSMERVDETVVNYDLIEEILELLFSQPSAFASTDGDEVEDGAVLIFLPGLREISTLRERLTASRFFGENTAIEVIPMHSSLSSKHHQRAFKPSRKGHRKIIISTNIAETSVTIPEVTCVIDSRLVREIQRDQRTGTQKLVTTWCSKANVKQRCGRAGRVQSGISLRLFSSRTEMRMKSVAEAELKRIPLEEVCLTILASGLSASCKSFLANAPEPPSKSAIDFALEDLRCIGAITIEELTRGSDIDGPQEKLTALGEHLTKLPIDARLGKMLIFGSLFQCLDPTLTLAACLSASNSPFASTISEGDEVRAAHATFSDALSDFVTLLNVWDAFVSAGPEARRFCRDKFLNYNALLEIAEAREIFLSYLCSIGFVDRKSIDNGTDCYNYQSKTVDVIHFVICAGLYPNVAKVEKDFELIHKTEKVVMINSAGTTKKLAERPSDWIAFNEKLGTGHRVTVSTTCFVHPVSLFLLGNVLKIDHVSRQIEIDNWIKLVVSGRTAVLLRQLRKELDRSLKTCIHEVGTENVPSPNVRAVKLINQIISLICQM